MNSLPSMACIVALMLTAIGGCKTSPGWNPKPAAAPGKTEPWSDVHLALYFYSDALKCEKRGDPPHSRRPHYTWRQYWEACFNALERNKSSEEVSFYKRWVHQRRVEMGLPPL